MQNLLAAASALITLASAAGIISYIVMWALRVIEGIRCQLRTTMLRTYYNHLEDKKIRQYEFENFEKTYNAYKALKGNSFIDKIHEEVRKWKVIT